MNCGDCSLAEVEVGNSVQWTSKGRQYALKTFGPNYPDFMRVIKFRCDGKTLMVTVRFKDGRTPVIPASHLKLAPWSD